MRPSRIGVTTSLDSEGLVYFLVLCAQRLLRALRPSAWPARLHAVGVQRDDAGFRVEVEFVRPEVMGRPACGGHAHAHGRQRVELIDTPCFTAPEKLWWRKRR